MMKRIIITASLLMATFLAVPLSAAAFDPFGGVDCSGSAASSAVCADKNPNSNPIAGPGSVLINVVHIIAFVAGIAAVILIIIGGIRYTTSGGDANNAKSARATIANALIGLVIIVLAQTLIAYVISKV